jgi:ankyrin repeat protein
MATPNYAQSLQVSELEYWSLLGKVDRVRALLDQGVDPNATDPDGYSALHGAAENGHVYVVKLLLGRGARACVCTRDGLTPLDLAEMTDHDDVAALLRNL